MQEVSAPPREDQPSDNPFIVPERPARPVVHLLQGMLVGTADVIPGISGGTVALIIGIYGRLIEAVRAVTGIPIALLRSGIGGVRRSLGEVEWAFILPLGIGVASAIGVGAFLIPPILEALPIESRAFFFGLVAASLYIPWKYVEQPRPVHYVMAVAFAAFAFLLVGLPAATTADPSLVRIFFGASIAICAMILPGVSGAFLLTVFGLYQSSLEALRTLDVVYLVVFLSGIAVGLAVAARLLSYLLRRHRNPTMVLLVGLLAGSLRALWPWQGEELILGEWTATPSLLLAPPTLGEAAYVAAIGLAGFALVAGLTWLGSRRAAKIEASGEI